VTILVMNPRAKYANAFNVARKMAEYLEDAVVIDALGSLGWRVRAIRKQPVLYTEVSFPWDEPTYGENVAIKFERTMPRVLADATTFGEPEQFSVVRKQITSDDRLTFVVAVTDPEWRKATGMNSAEQLADELDAVAAATGLAGATDTGFVIHKNPRFVQLDFDEFHPLATYLTFNVFVNAVDALMLSSVGHVNYQARAVQSKQDSDGNHIDMRIRDVDPSIADLALFLTAGEVVAAIEQVALDEFSAIATAAVGLTIKTSPPVVFATVRVTAPIVTGLWGYSEALPDYFADSSNGNGHPSQYRVLKRIREADGTFSFEVAIFDPPWNNIDDEVRVCV
jgi:hypothetical protein